MELRASVVYVAERGGVELQDVYRREEGDSRCAPGFGKTFSKNNLSQFDEKTQEHVQERNRRGEKRKLMRCADHFSPLWKLGYSLTAAGPAIILYLTVPCRPVSHTTTTTCTE